MKKNEPTVAVVRSNRPERGRAWALTVAALSCAAVLAAGPVSHASARVDLNSASVSELESLPGIGPAKAAAIVEARTKGRFESVDDLERIKGIGPSVVDGLRESVTVSKADAKKR